MTTPRFTPHPAPVRTTRGRDMTWGCDARPQTPGRFPQPASIRLQRVGGRVGRRPIPQGPTYEVEVKSGAGWIGQGGVARPAFRSS